MKKALVTFATGLYLDHWRAYAMPVWNIFCERYDYDLICFSDSIDSSVRASLRSVAWQKLICHEHPKLRDYDYILWLDADVLINPSAPDPLLSANPHKVNACHEFTWGSDAQVAHLAKSWYLQQSQTFEQRYPGSKFQGYSNIWGFGDGSGPLINTGFLLFSPSLHGHFFRHVYDSYDDSSVKHWGEMVPLSEELHRNQLFNVMDQRYNMLLVPYLNTLLSGSNTSKMRIVATISMIYRALNDNYFLHFAGFKFLGMRFMHGASWDATNGFKPNVPEILSVMRENLEVNGLVLDEDC